MVEDPTEAFLVKQEQLSDLAALSTSSFSTSVAIHRLSNLSADQGQASTPQPRFHSFEKDQAV